jgi:hypothetical protein
MSYRQFHDDQGRTWEVWEVHPSAVERRVNEERRKSSRETPDRRRNQDVQFPMPPELAEGWLAFQSDDARRRLAPIPVHWDSLSDEELLKLARQAQPPRHSPRAQLPAPPSQQTTPSQPPRG